MFTATNASLLASLRTNSHVLESTAANGGLTNTMGSRSERVLTRYDGLNPSVSGGRTPRFLRGKVSYSQKPGVSKTGYSYDELGRVAWMVQDITGLGVKTVDYLYDKTGAVQVLLAFIELAEKSSNCKQGVSSFQKRQILQQ